MADFLLYWRPSTVDALPAGEPLSTAASDQFSRVRVRDGDVLWAVTSRSEGDLRLVARIGVQHLTTSREQAELLASGRYLWTSFGTCGLTTDTFGCNFGVATTSSRWSRS